MHFNLDRPASLDAYLANIRGLLPAVDALMLRHRETRLSDYVDWLNREQSKILEYLKAENAVLRQQLGKKRLRLRCG